MQILFFRHGIAEESSSDGRDASRRLTAEGVAKTRRAVRGLARLGPRPDVILSSPKLRAKQTAELAGRAFDRPVTILAELAGDSTQAILAAMTPPREGCVMLVGHEPVLSAAVSMLCAGSSSSDCGSFVALRKAGCACVQVASLPGQAPMPGTGMLLWLATPAMLRRLGR